jgi:hypothetical protein
MAWSPWTLCDTPGFGEKSNFVMNGFAKPPLREFPFGHSRRWHGLLLRVFMWPSVAMRPENEFFPPLSEKGQGPSPLFTRRQRWPFLLTLVLELCWRLKAWLARGLK